MKKSILFILCLLSFSCSFTFAQTFDSAGQAVWVWKVKSNSRVVYLMGELHKFISLGDLNINYSLGEAVYSASSSVWIEPEKQVLSSKPPEEKISEKLSPNTLARLEQLTLNAISATNKNLTTEQKNALLQKTIREIDKSSAFSSFVGLMALAEMRNLKNARGYKTFKGMSTKLSERDLISGLGKIKIIEKDDTVERVWIDQCSNTIDSEIVIIAALDYYENGVSFDNGSLKKVQGAFLKAEISENDFLKISESEPYWSSIRKCNIVPRNSLWLPKIIDTLEATGAPEAFLVGNNHIIGKGGLIELLKKLGYTNIERIYSFN
jgi:hypothetical protein